MNDPQHKVRPKIFQQNEGRIKERKGKFTANMNNTCFNTAGTIVAYYVFVTWK